MNVRGALLFVTWLGCLVAFAMFTTDPGTTNRRNALLIVLIAGPLFVLMGLWTRRRADKRRDRTRESEARRS